MIQRRFSSATVSDYSSFFLWPFLPDDYLICSGLFQEDWHSPGHKVYTGLSAGASGNYIQLVSLKAALPQTAGTPAPVWLAPRMNKQEGVGTYQIIKKAQVTQSESKTFGEQKEA